MDSKKWYASKSFWFFVLSIVVSVAGLFGFAEFQPSADQATIIALIISVGGLILRFVTSKGIEL